MKKLVMMTLGFGLVSWAGAQETEDTSEYAPIQGKFLPDAKTENQKFVEELKQVVGGRLTYEERIKRLEENGGTKECEDAIVKCLDWMQKRQNEKGYWEDQHRVAMTGLALLAYLGHGETPGGEGPYDETVQKAIQYLIGVSANIKGLLSEDPKDRALAYEHAIAVYALSEAYILGLTQEFEIEGLPQAIIAGANRIVEGQAEDGSWGYDLKKNGDLSIIAWCMQALKATSHTGLPIEGLQEASQKGMEAVVKHQSEDGSYRYKPGSKNGEFLTGAGVLCHQQWGSGNSEQAATGVNWIDQNAQFEWSPSKLYHHYYMGQAMFEYGGVKWIQYNQSFRDTIIAHQNEEGAFAKGQKKGKDKNKGIRKYQEHGGNRLKYSYSWKDHYHSCLATLKLEVYFRYLPGTNDRSYK
jgi:hypothetical protein